MKLTTYSVKTNKTATLDLPKAYEAKANESLLAQAIRVYEDRKHPGLSKTKTRGEVTVSTKKIYKQKGTGGARHGARSAPIFVGGGVTHGPRGAKRSLILPKKMKQKALRVAVSLKVREGSVFIAEDLENIKKTKDAAGLIDKIVKAQKEVNKGSKFTFVLSEENAGKAKMIGNISNVNSVSFNSLNALDIYYSQFLIIDKAAFTVKKEVASTKKKIQRSQGEPAKEVKNTKYKKAK